MMIVGTLSVVISIPGSDSLKDKRQVVRSTLALIRNKFSISAAEVDFLNQHRKAELGFACVSNDKTVVNSILNKVLDFIESNPLCEVLDSELVIN